MQWWVRKFDLATGRYTGTLWDITSEVDYFVDSVNGDDTNSGQYNAITGKPEPFKTLGKVKSLGAGIWEDGLVVMINGYFSEPTVINKEIILIGAGGGWNDKTILTGLLSCSSGIYPIIHNAYIDSTNFFIFTTTTDNLYFNNCIFINLYCSLSVIMNFYCNNCIFVNLKLLSDKYNVGFKLYCFGNNNTFYDTVRSNPTYIHGTINLVGNNNHINNAIYSTDTGANNIKNVDGNYLDVSNLNFNFLNTSPLYRTGTFDIVEGYNNHVGAGSEGQNYNASNAEMDSASGATYTNLTKDGTTLFRTDDTIDGELETDYFDFAEIKKQFAILNNSAYDVLSEKLIRLIQQTNAPSDRDGLDFYIKYGITTGEVDSCPWLLCEYGKLVTVSGTGASRVGNADASFDASTAYYAQAQYCITKHKFVDRS